MRERKRARVSGWVGWYQGKEEEEGGRWTEDHTLNR